MTPLVMLAGGGTAGHVFPALAVAAALRDARPHVQVEFVGTQAGPEGRLVAEGGWRLHPVTVVPFVRKPSLGTVRAPFALARATAVVRRLLARRGAGAAAVFGGYVSLPLAMAARSCRLPVVVHEQNAVPGLANRLAARGAAAVAATFPGAQAVFPAGAPVVVTGNPVRPGLGLDAGDRARLRREALAAFSLHADRRTLLVFGGSQGAQTINRAVIGSVGIWDRPGRLQILHAAGRREHAGAQAAWQQALRDEPANGLLVRCVDFIDRMELAYAAADAVVCRAGASSIAELTVLGLPSVLVPYPHATADHQTANARALQAAGAAGLVADAALDGPALVRVAGPMLDNPDHAATVGAAARAFARPHAARDVAALVLSALDAGRQP